MVKQVLPVLLVRTVSHAGTDRDDGDFVIGMGKLAVDAVDLADNLVLFQFIIAHHQDDKLVPAGPADIVAQAKILFQLAGNLLENEVTHFVSVGVVHMLEFIRVENNQGGGPDVAAPDDLFVSGAVHQAGQPVCMGLISQNTFGVRELMNHDIYDDSAENEHRNVPHQMQQRGHAFIKRNPAVGIKPEAQHQDKDHSTGNRRPLGGHVFVFERAADIFTEENKKRHAEQRNQQTARPADTDSGKDDLDKLGRIDAQRLPAQLFPFGKPEADADHQDGDQTDHNHDIGAAHEKQEQKQHMKHQETAGNQIHAPQDSLLVHILHKFSLPFHGPELQYM